MKPKAESLACTTAQASVNGIWHPLSTFGSEFNLNYTVTVDSPAISSSAVITVHGTLVDVVKVGTPSAGAIFPLAAAGANPTGLAISSAQGTPVAAIMVSIAAVSSDITGTFRYLQQGV